MSTRILIVGGVAGGASAAARARRLSEDAQIVLFERGEHISFANCGLPYHIGGTIQDRSRLLVQTPESFTRRFAVDVRTNTEVVRIDRQAHQVVVRDVTTAAESTEAYDALILSPGAEPVRPPIPGVASPRVFTLRSLADMDAIKQAVDSADGGRAVIVGGGYIGLEMAEALRHRGMGVTMVELATQVFAPVDSEMAQPIHQQLQFNGVELRLGQSVSQFRDEGDGLCVKLSGGEEIHAALAILAIGVRPEVTLAKAAGLDLGVSGGIRVDEHMRTSDPQIFAVGDAVEVTSFVDGLPMVIPLAGPANRQGRIAADNALGRNSIYRRTQGTAIVKVFDLAVGMTGLSEKVLQRHGRLYEKVYVHPASHASYYPGATPLSLKLLFDPQDGRILGAQAVGAKGVDKRIDVLAVALRAGMTVYNLQDLELSYAPPYGSAKDPINYAGFVAANVLKGDVKLCHTPDMLAPKPTQMLLDVRMPAEVQAGTIGSAVNIPIDDLRKRLGELPRDKELLVFCAVGLRGYLACRILTQNGFECRNLTGGYKTYRMATDCVAGSGNCVAGVSPAQTGGAADSVSCCGAPRANAAPGALNPAVPTKRDDQMNQSVALVKDVDACGLQCPGPIMKLAREMQSLQDGQALSIRATDPAFAGDVEGWCRSTGNVLLELGRQDGQLRAVVQRLTASATAAAPSRARRRALGRRLPDRALS